MEPEDVLDDIAHQQELLATYRRNLRFRLSQVARHGGIHKASLDVVNDIHESRRQIRHIKKTLSASGITVPDHPDDEPQPDSAESPDDMLAALLRQAPSRSDDISPVARKSVGDNERVGRWSSIVREIRSQIVVVVILAVTITVFFFFILRDRSGNNAFAPTAVSVPTIAPSRVPATLGPTAAPSIKPSDTAVAGGIPLLLEDNFDNARKRDLWVHDDDNFTSKFIDGKYVVTIKEPRIHLDPPISSEDYADVAIEVDVSIEGPKTGTAGIVFRYQDFKNYYSYAVDSEGRYSLFRIKDQHLDRLIDQATSPAIKAGQTNKLRVVTKGDSIQLYANGELIDQATDGALASGKASLLVDTDDDPNVTASFDNLIVQPAP